RLKPSSTNFVTRWPARSERILIRAGARFCSEQKISKMSIRMEAKMWAWATTLFLTTLLNSGIAAAAEREVRLKPGEFVIDPPTLINLGFEWVIQGDDNRNAKVEVSYRKQGKGQWRQGLPLMRLQGERIYQNQGVFDVVSPNMFAGSILDLEPN